MVTSRKKIAVSGANGFLGSALITRLLELNRPVHAFVRNPIVIQNRWQQTVGITSLEQPHDWHDALQSCHAVVHCAARVHVTYESAADSLAEFRTANVDLTVALARQAAESGVQRFIFVSTIGVNGGCTYDKSFTPEDDARPHNPYAVSKYEAECALLKIAQETGLSVVVVRPPLIYGPNAPGNFASLIHILRRRWPLPLASAINNRRSFIAIDNLVDLLVTCVDHPDAANQIFLASDGDDLSTAQLLHQLGKALGLPARLWSMPIGMLKVGACVLGKKELAQRLLGSLQVDISKTRRLLNWTPALGVEQAFTKYFKENGK
jgi:nucleoside-diphosphate-sugar epimerase